MIFDDLRKWVLEHGRLIDELAELEDGERCFRHNETLYAVQESEIPEEFRAVLDRRGVKVLEDHH